MTENPSFSPERICAVVKTVESLYPDESFTSGMCGVLAVALHTVIQELPDTPENLHVTVMFRVEEFEGSEVTSLSHIMLCFTHLKTLYTVDVSGVGADERWQSYVEESIAPFSDADDYAFRYQDHYGCAVKEQLQSLAVDWGMARHTPEVIAALERRVRAIYKGLE